MARRNDVFINCPFDARYRKIFRAIVFTVLDCNFEPHCALNRDDSGHIRVEKIYRMIGSCLFGIHDISRTEPDKKTKLPRFNMPFELGLFLGAREYGGRKQKRKVTLILDKEPFRYQKFISDIAGQDIHAHRDKPAEVISIVRNWFLHATREDGRDPLPSGKVIAERYASFEAELPALCTTARLDDDKLTYRDYTWLVRKWLERNALEKQ
jgi:hypothetical protein